MNGGKIAALPPPHFCLETEGENDDWWGQGDQVTPTLFDLISGTSLVWLLS